MELKTIFKLSELISETEVVQDYDEKYTIVNGHRPEHHSYNLAKWNGFVYGLTTNNGSKNWTQLIMLKGSETLVSILNSKGHKEKSIEAITFQKQATSDLTRVSVTAMKGIASISIGFVKTEEVDNLKKSVCLKDTA